MPSAHPSVAAVAVKFPPNLYSQEEAHRGVDRLRRPGVSAVCTTSGVESRHTALPLTQYKQLTGFTDANETFSRSPSTLPSRRYSQRSTRPSVEPSDVDVVFSTTVTGLAVPTLEARLAARVGLRQDVKRVPLFGLGCVAGAAGLARVHDYLRAFPDHVAVLLAVELCSLTVQREDMSIANLVAFQPVR